MKGWDRKDSLKIRLNLKKKLTISLQNWVDTGSVDSGTVPLKRLPQSKYNSLNFFWNGPRDGKEEQGVTVIPSMSNATAAVMHFVFQGSDLTAQCVLDGSSMFLCSGRDVRLAYNSLPPAAARTRIQFNRAADRVKAFTGHHNTQFPPTPVACVI